MKTVQDIQSLADLIQSETQARLVAEGFTLEIHRPNCTTHIHMGKKFARVDVGTSGKYMVELETGIIYGIKAYDVVHRGHVFGTLDTIADFDWSGYVAHRKALPAA